MFPVEKMPPWSGEDAQQLLTFLLSRSGEKFRRIISDGIPSGGIPHRGFPSPEFLLGYVAGSNAVVAQTVALVSPEEKLPGDTATALPDLDDHSAWNADGTPKR